MKYRKKPVVIEAMQLTDTNVLTVMNFIGGVGIVVVGYGYNDEPFIKIRTLEGEMLAAIGDYIIRGVKGEFYPCKPDIFEMTYESVENEQ